MSITLHTRPHPISFVATKPATSARSDLVHADASRRRQKSGSYLLAYRFHRAEDSLCRRAQSRKPSSCDAKQDRNHSAFDISSRKQGKRAPVRTSSKVTSAVRSLLMNKQRHYTSMENKAFRELLYAIHHRTNRLYRVFVLGHSYFYKSHYDPKPVV